MYRTLTHERQLPSNLGAELEIPQLASLGRSSINLRAAVNVRFNRNPTFTAMLANDGFVPKDVDWQPRWRETLSLSPMRDKRVFPVIRVDSI
jgi:hypothetical protein